MIKLLYTIGEAAALLGIAVVTLRRWTASNAIPFSRTLGGHRRFKHADLFPKKDGVTLLYARVSSRDQKEDLQRQVETLQSHCVGQQWSETQVLQDIRSGLNTRKPGLRKLIALVLSGKVQRFVITHKDRLLRFANDLLLDICRSFGVAVVILRHEEKDAQAQWCESIVEIMTVFCEACTENGRTKIVAWRRCHLNQAVELVIMAW